MRRVSVRCSRWHWEDERDVQLSRLKVTRRAGLFRDILSLRVSAHANELASQQGGPLR